MSIFSLTGHAKRLVINGGCITCVENGNVKLLPSILTNQPGAEYQTWWFEGVPNQTNMYKIRNEAEIYLRVANIASGAIAVSGNEDNATTWVVEQDPSESSNYAIYVEQTQFLVLVKVDNGNDMIIKQEITVNWPVIIHDDGETNPIV